MKQFKIFDNNLNVELDIFLGNNAQENWILIDKSSANDLWFHLDGKPSPHVILKIPNKGKIHKQTILYCGMICKQYSKYEFHKNISIIYTEIKNITKGKEVGSVHTKRTQKFSL